MHVLWLRVEKANVSLCSVEHYGMKAYRGLEVKLHAFLSSVLDGASSQLHPPAALPTAKNLQYSPLCRLGGFQIQPGSFWRREWIPGVSSFFLRKLFFMGRDSSVGIATRYGLDGPGIESLWAPDFPHPSRLTLGSTQPPTKWLPGLARG